MDSLKRKVEDAYHQALKELHGGDKFSYAQGKAYAFDQVLKWIREQDESR